jgi:hypothetical protein
MFRQLTAFILLFALVAQTFNKAIVVSSYYSNTAAYAKNCENKAKPKLQCNGKCQMMKKLKEEEKKEQKNNSKQSQDEVLSSKSFFASVHFKQQTTTNEFSIYHSGSAIDRASDFFHPPSI